jgi:hypothetical protein
MKTALFLTLLAVSAQALAQTNSSQPKAQDVYTTAVPKPLTKREALMAAIKNEAVYKCTLQTLNDKVQLVKAK